MKQPAGARRVHEFARKPYEILYRPGLAACCAARRTIVEDLTIPIFIFIFFLLPPFLAF
jgi:hypothetical protein